MNTLTAKQKTPDLILDNAQLLMLREGFHGVSVDNIIEKSQISKGTFFYHFKSKHMLAEKLLERFISDQDAMLSQVMSSVEAQSLSPLETIVGFCEELPKLAQQAETIPGCLMAAFCYQLTDEHPELKSLCQQALTNWQTFLAPYFIRALSQTLNSQLSDTKENVAQELAHMAFCLMEGAYISERIADNHQLETQFRHFTEYVRLLANPISGN